VGERLVAVAGKRRQERLCLGAEKMKAGKRRCTWGGSCMRCAWRPGGRWRVSERARSKRSAGSRQTAAQAAAVVRTGAGMVGIVNQPVL
jgi:hypothetical protein